MSVTVAGWFSGCTWTHWYLVLGFTHCNKLIKTSPWNIQQNILIVINMKLIYSKVPFSTAFDFSQNRLWLLRCLKADMWEYGITSITTHLMPRIIGQFFVGVKWGWQEGERKEEWPLWTFLLISYRMPWNVVRCHSVTYFSDVGQGWLWLSLRPEVLCPGSMNKHNVIHRVTCLNQFSLKFRDCESSFQDLRLNVIIHTVLSQIFPFRWNHNERSC